VTWNGLAHTASLFCGAAAVAPLGVFTGVGEYVLEAAAPIPKIAIGTSDFTIEWVVLFRDGDPSIGAADIPMLSGLTEELTAGITFGEVSVGWSILPNGAFATTSVALTYNVTGGAAGGTTFVSWPAPRTSWLHVVATYDRSALLEGWLNGVKDVIDPTDISPDVAFPIPSLAINPFIAETTIRDDFDDLSEDPTSVSLNKLIMGGFAIHNRLLTPTEIAANSTALTVGNYGSGTTLVRYDFKTLVDSLGADIDLSNPPSGVSVFTPKADMAIGQKWTVPSTYLAGLKGILSSATAVLIKDTSGNVRHFPLATNQLSYGSTSLSDRCNAVFSTPNPGP